MKRDTAGITASRINNQLRSSELDILEIGCGDGRVTSGLRNGRRRIVAVDPEEKSLAVARASVSGVDFRLGSGERLDFPAGSFDAVLFSLSLHHQDGQTALYEAHRVLKEGGMCLILEPALDGEMQLLSHLFVDESEALLSARRAVENNDFEHMAREVAWSSLNSSLLEKSCLFDMIHLSWMKNIDAYEPPPASAYSLRQGSGNYYFTLE